MGIDQRLERGRVSGGTVRPIPLAQKQRSVYLRLPFLAKRRDSCCNIALALIERILRAAACFHYFPCNQTLPIMQLNN